MPPKRSRSGRFLRFELAKYSRAVDIPKDQPTDKLTWSHVTENCFITIDATPKEHLRVFHGSQVMESIPIQELIKDANNVAKKLEKMGIQNKPELLPISAIIRSPSFALRHITATDFLRRIQLKFVSDRDFASFISYVRDMGLRMTSNDSRPATAIASSSVTSAQTTAGQSPPAGRLAGMNKQTSSAALASMQTTNTVPSSRIPRLTEMNQRSSNGTLTSAQTTNIGQPSPVARLTEMKQRSSNGTLTSAQTTNIGKPSPVARLTEMNQQSSNATLTSRQTSNTGQRSPGARFAGIQQRPSTSTAFPSYYTNSTTPRVSSPLARHAITAAAKKYGAPQDSHPAPPAEELSLSAGYSNHTPLDKPEFFPHLDSSSSSIGRPSSGAEPVGRDPNAMEVVEEPSFPTVPSTSAMLSTHRQMEEPLLPPRRELPWARSSSPKSAGSDSARPMSHSSGSSCGRPPSRSIMKPSTGAMGPATLPSPSQIRRSVSFDLGSSMDVDQPSRAQTAVQRTPSFPQELQRPNTSFLLGNANGGSQQENSASPSRPVSRHASTGFNENLDLPPLPRPTFIDNAATNNESTLAENTGSLNRFNSLPTSYDLTNDDSQSNSRQPLRSMSSSDQNMSMTGPSTFTLALTNSSSAGAPRPTSAEHQSRVITEIQKDLRGNANGLASFAAMSEEDRQAFLQNFFWKNIDDENFITLVESVSTCWAANVLP